MYLYLTFGSDYYNRTLQLLFPSYLRVSQAKSWFLVILMKQHCRDGSTHSDGNSTVDPLEISHWGQDSYLLYPRNHRHNWSFAFTHASTSSKCILFSIRYLIQLPKYTRSTEWTVSEVIDWLKVRDLALITEIFCNPDIWEEPNSGSSTTGSADRMDGRCTQENRGGGSDPEADEY